MQHLISHVLPNQGVPVHVLFYYIQFVRNIQVLNNTRVEHAMNLLNEKYYGKPMTH